jgi:hypothetical protein
LLGCSLLCEEQEPSEAGASCVVLVALMLLVLKTLLSGMMMNDGHSYCCVSYEFQNATS